MKKAAAVLLVVVLVSSSAFAGSVEFGKGEYDPNNPGPVLLDVTVRADNPFDFADVLFASRVQNLDLTGFNFSADWMDAFSFVAPLLENPLGMLPTELFASSANATPVGPTLLMGQLVVDLSAMGLTKADAGTQLEVFVATSADLGFALSQVGFGGINEEIPGTGIINVVGGNVEFEAQGSTVLHSDPDKGQTIGTWIVSLAYDPVFDPFVAIGALIGVDSLNETVGPEVDFTADPAFAALFTILSVDDPGPGVYGSDILIDGFILVGLFPSIPLPQFAGILTVDATGVKPGEYTIVIDGNSARDGGLSVLANQAGARVPLVGSTTFTVNDDPVCRFIVGGAIYTDCDNPLTSGEPNVQVTVAGPGGTFTATTGGSSGIWQIPDVPCGTYTVTPERPFKEFCHVAGVCPPDPCTPWAEIIVDEAHLAENLSIQFLGGEACVRNDMNYDGMCTIVYDVDCFVQCVYFGDCIADPEDNCTAPDGADLCCPADCNCDEMCTIVNDVGCFVTDVYFGGGCSECPRPGSGLGAVAAADGNARSGFTIGGAVYQDEVDPLLSGIEQVPVWVHGPDGKTFASTETVGPMGLWRIDGVPEGIYTVVFAHKDGRASTRADSITIVVDAANRAGNQSIRLLRAPNTSRLPEIRRNAPAAKDRSRVETRGGR